MTIFEALALKFGLSRDQLAALEAVTVDLGGLALRAKKDEERMQLFIMAVANKEAGYAANVALLMLRDLDAAKAVADEARVFSNGAGLLLKDWIATGTNAWKKLSLARLFGWDPFKDLRQQTRMFAAKWDLDPAFRQAMG